jgi:hypothetical protein
MWILKWISYKNVCWWVMILIGIFSFTFAQDWGDCWLSLGPEEFQEWVKETLAEKEIPQLFFTDNQLEAVQKSLDTYCCRTNKISQESCASKTLYPDGKNVIHSPYYLDHFLSVYALYLRWDTSVCNQYDFDCFTRIDEKNQYPGKPLCFRYGAEWDTRCESLYDVGSWVDILWASTDISSPSNYRALYEKFRVDSKTILIPEPEKAKDMDPKDLSLMHMWRYMCNEVDAIYTHVLRANTTSDQSMNPIPWSTLQKCQTEALSRYKSHAYDYVNILSLAKWVDQMKQVNTTSREHILDSMDDLKKTMNAVRSTMTTFLRKFQSFTNECST